MTIAPCPDLMLNKRVANGLHPELYLGTIGNHAIGSAGFNFENPTSEEGPGQSASDSRTLAGETR